MLARHGRRWLSILFTLGLIIHQPRAAIGDDTVSSPIVATIKASLAHIIVHDGKSVASGTGFCIGSHDDTAYILTNKHVVGSDDRPRVILLSDPDSELYGRIDRVSTFDAVILAVDRAKCSPLSLNTNPPSIGASVAIAGFRPFRFQSQTTLLRRSRHFTRGR
jgi:S1-C subfamily serine protease